MSRTGRSFYFCSRGFFPTLAEVEIGVDWLLKQAHQELYVGASTVNLFKDFREQPILRQLAQKKAFKKGSSVIRRWTPNLHYFGPSGAMVLIAPVPEDLDDLDDFSWSVDTLVVGQPKAIRKWARTWNASPLAGSPSNDFGNIALPAAVISKLDECCRRFAGTPDLSKPEYVNLFQHAMDTLEADGHNFEIDDVKCYLVGNKGFWWRDVKKLKPPGGRVW